MAKKLTLGQATGGRPAKVAAPRPAPKQAAAPRPAAPRQAPQPPQSQYRGAPSLGLGLGLGANQQRNFQQAVQSGNASQFMGAHPQLQQRMTGFNAPNNPHLQARANFLTSGQSQRPPPQPRGGVNSDVMGGQMPQPPPTQYQPPLSPQPQQPAGSMGQVGAGMYGNLPNNPQYGQQSGAPSPFASSYGSAQDALSQWGPAGNYGGTGRGMGGQTSGGYGYRPQSMGQMGQMAGQFGGMMGGGGGQMGAAGNQYSQMGAQMGGMMDGQYGGMQNLAGAMRQMGGGYGGGAGSGGGIFNPQNPMLQQFQQQQNPYQQGGGGY